MKFTSTTTLLPLAAAAWLMVVAMTTPKMVVAERATLSIHGSGTTNPSKCYWNVMDKMEDRAKVPLHMTYRAIGSSSGQAEFRDPGAITDFGSGDIPLTKELYDEMTAAGTTVLQLPVFVGAVGVFHTVPNTPTLNLTACTLAKIFSRQITNWNHDEITALNPELQVPSGGLSIHVARRVDGSSSTSGISAYLANACPSVWASDNVGSKVTWAEGTKECQGSGGVVDCINEEPGSIGYLDSGHGHLAGFAEVYLENSFGTKLTTREAIARGGVAAAADVAGVLPSSPTDDFSSVSLINQPGEFTWPIALLTYVYVRQNLSFHQNPQEQALIKAFLQALYDDSYVETCVEEYEFAKVTGAALELAQEAIDSLIINASAIPFQFEEDTIELEAQGEYYISAKRSSFTQIEVEVLQTTTAQLTDRVTELERLLQQAMLQMSQMTGGGATAAAGTTEGADPLLLTNAAQDAITTGGGESDQNAEIAAALAMSVISIILSLVVLFMLVTRSVAGHHQVPKGAANNGTMEHIDEEPC